MRAESGPAKPLITPSASPYPCIPSRSALSSLPMDGGAIISEPALLAEDIHKSFGDLEVLKGVSLRAEIGDVISIIGSSGSGKYTLLRCLYLLEITYNVRFTIC